VVHNIRELYAGEAITENYGPMFMFHPKEERLQKLKNRYSPFLNTGTVHYLLYTNCNNSELSNQSFEFKYIKTLKKNIGVSTYLNIGPTIYKKKIISI